MHFKRLSLQNKRRVGDLMHLCKQYPANHAGYDYFTSSIDGRLSEFLKALEFFNFNEQQDRVFVIGNISSPNGELDNEILNLFCNSSFINIIGKRDYDLYTSGKYIPAINSSLLADVELISGEFLGLTYAECPLTNWAMVKQRLIEGLITPEELIDYDIRYRVKDTVSIRGIEAVYHGMTPVSKVEKLGNRFYINIVDENASIIIHR